MTWLEKKRAAEKAAKAKREMEELAAAEEKAAAERKRAADAGHTYEEVVYDINRFVNALDKPTFIFDDYGHEGKTVRNDINAKLSDGTMKLVTHIGEDRGFVAANGKTFIGREGVVCNV